MDGPRDWTVTAVQRLATLAAQINALTTSLEQWRQDYRAGMDTMQAVLRRDIDALKDDVRCLREELDEKYVRKEAHEPVRIIVYAIVTIIAGGFLTGAVAFFWRGGG